MLAATLVVAACIVYTVSFRIIDSDFWQHLLVGRVIWERGAIPRQNLWSWASYGRPEVLPSWLFRWMLWPFYSWAGVTGLFEWRWITTLAAFGFAWAAARRLGAKGLTPLVVLAWCALVYRPRSQVRPETLAAVLLAAELWILERVRHGERRTTLWLAWLVPITWVWVNAHVSYFLGFVLLGIHGWGAWLGWRPARSITARPPVAPYLYVALAMAAVAFANPFGWSGLWQPFDYAFHLSQEPLFRGIGELQPVTFSTGWRYGLWLMIMIWPLLGLLRVARHGFDRVEAVTAVLVMAYALPSQRFLGVYALVAAPYLARDLEEWVERLRWPRWTARPGARAALAALACVAFSLPEWARPLLRPGIGVDLERFPVAACDFMEHHGIRGRGFEHFRFVGYQAWRFWPDRGRLPFLDIHQSGTPEDRAAFAAAFTEPESWPRIAARYRFDYALLDRRQRSGVGLLDVIDADSSWALVFLDDVSALYLNRLTQERASDSLAFRVLGGGERRLAELAGGVGDSTLRADLRADLDRAIASSRLSATAHLLRSSVDMAGDHADQARADIEAALAIDPWLPDAHQRLGVVALWQERPQVAIEEFERERASNPEAAAIDVGLGLAYQQLGDLNRARRYFEVALERDPGNAVARARLDTLSRSAPR
jgi:hypothetical protein